MSKEFSSHKLRTKHTHLSGGGWRSRLWFFLDAETREQCDGVEKAIKIALLGPIPVTATIELTKTERNPAIGFGVPNE